jgi:hypothetical protein
MFVIFGTQHYGQVDRVPGLFSVKTSFFHINYVLLVPTGSHLVLEGTETADGFRGTPIPLSPKSVLAGYVRNWFGIAALVAAIVTGLLFPLLFGVKSGDDYHTAMRILGAALHGGLALAVMRWAGPNWWVLQAVFAVATAAEVAALSLTGHPVAAWTLAAFAANLTLAVYSLTRFLDHAGHERAVELGAMLGMDRESVEQLLAAQTQPPPPPAEDDWKPPGE